MEFDDDRRMFAAFIRHDTGAVKTLEALSQSIHTHITETMGIKYSRNAETFVGDALFQNALDCPYGQEFRRLTELTSKGIQPSKGPGNDVDPTWIKEDFADDLAEAQSRPEEDEEEIRAHRDVMDKDGFTEAAAQKFTAFLMSEPLAVPKRRALPSHLAAIADVVVDAASFAMLHDEYCAKYPKDYDRISDVFKHSSMPNPVRFESIVTAMAEELRYYVIEQVSSIEIEKAIANKVAPTQFGPPKPPAL